MVCIYCGQETKVVNSRLQKKTNSVWRRRKCLKCSAVFTSLERTAYESSLAVQDQMSHIMPFQRDVLFLSIYDACRHRSAAITDASALTDTVLGKLLAGRHITNGIVQRQDIVAICKTVLAAFDAAAGVHYAAFHH